MPEPTQKPSKSFFTYESADGEVFITDSLQDIPAKYRSKAKAVDAGEIVRGLPKRSLKRAKMVQRKVGDLVPFVRELDLPSVAVGFALSLVMFLVLSLVRRTGRLLLKVGLTAAIVALLTSAYFGWIRKSAGVAGSSGPVSPKTVIKDARDAKTKLEKRLREQQRMLKKIEESSK